MGLVLYNRIRTYRVIIVSRSNWGMTLVTQSRFSNVRIRQLPEVNDMYLNRCKDRGPFRTFSGGMVFLLIPQRWKAFDSTKKQAHPYGSIHSFTIIWRMPNLPPLPPPSITRLSCSRRSHFNHTLTLGEALKHSISILRLPFNKDHVARRTKNMLSCLFKQYAQSQQGRPIHTAEVYLPSVYSCSAIEVRGIGVDGFE